jgi:hypothetical protein
VAGEKPDNFSPATPGFDVSAEPRTSWHIFSFVAHKRKYKYIIFLFQLKIRRNHPFAALKHKIVTNFPIRVSHESVDRGITGVAVKVILLRVEARSVGIV